MRTKLLLTAGIVFAALFGTANAQSYDHLGGRDPYAGRAPRDNDRYERRDKDRFYDRDDRFYDRDDRWRHERRERERWERMQRHERHERMEEMREGRRHR